MTVVAIAEIFGISGRRNELAALLERFERWAAGEHGCRRYVAAATLAHPSRFVLVSEWDSQESLDEHYNSQAFAEFELDLDGLLARPSQLTVYSADEAPAREQSPDGPARRGLISRASGDDAPTVGGYVRFDFQHRASAPKDWSRSARALGPGASGASAHRQR